MKLTRRLLFVTLLVSICLIASQFVSAQTLYDDFSGSFIDNNKWNQSEFVREVTNGQLASKITTESGTPRNRTRIQNAGAVFAIQADVTVVETSLTNGDGFARIEGTFYNSQPAGGVTGDIWAAVKIIDEGNGLSATYEVNEALDDDWSNYNIPAEGEIASSLNYGQVYTVKIEYDEGENKFTFTVGTDSVEVDDTTLPANLRADVGEFSSLTTGINDAVSGVNFVSALFDNVYINNEASAYDMFDSPLDARWRDNETVREIENGRARLNAQGVDERAQTTLSLTDSDASLVQAKVRIESDSILSAGATGIFRIQGYFYNESRGPGSGLDYNAYEGDVFGQLRIELEDDGTLRARAMVDRSDDADENNYTLRLSQDFLTGINLDTDYTVSIEYTGTALIFKCNDETITYTITTNQYTPYGEHRSLRSRVYLDPGESGYLKTSVDEVYVEGTGGGDGGDGDDGGDGGDSGDDDGDGGGSDSGLCFMNTIK